MENNSHANNKMDGETTLSNLESGHKYEWRGEHLKREFWKIYNAQSTLSMAELLMQDVNWTSRPEAR